MFFSRRKILSATMAMVLSATIFTGCGSDEQQQAQQMPAQQVKVMKVIQRNTPLASEYAGQIVGLEEVKVQSKVSGNVVEKFFRGGDYVNAGDLLFKIDSRQYETQILQAKAALAETEASLQNAIIDLQRDELLLSENAIAEQTVTTQRATVRAYEASANAKQASIRLAEENLADTLIYAPISGKLGLDDVAVGTFASPGATTLVTIGSTDPIFVQFSISEAEYLKFLTIQSMQTDRNPLEVTITLTDGKEYPLSGQIVETDRKMANNTGSLIMKAVFPNPSGALIPGMFARVRLTGETIPNAILVPQRAVQQLLGKSFVMVVGKDNKSETRDVELGPQVGSYYVITKGITAQDSVVVEGLTTLSEGVDLAITNVTEKDMGFSMVSDTKTYNSDANLTKPIDSPNTPENLNK